MMSGGHDTSPPIRRTPLFRKHVSLNATIVNSGGWLIPDSYTKPQVEFEAATRSVGISDISAATKVDVAGDRIDAFLSRFLEDTEVPTRPGQVTAHTRGNRGALPVKFVSRLANDHALIVLDGPLDLSGSSPIDVEVLETVEGVYLTNVSSVLAGLALVGPLSTRVLERLTGVNLSLEALPTPGCVQGGVAEVQSTIIRWNPRGKEDADRFELYFGRDYAEYLWDALMTAGSAFNIAPIGMAAHLLLSSGASGKEGQRGR